MLPRGYDSTRKDLWRAAGPDPIHLSRQILQRLSGSRLPEGEKIGDVSIRFQFRLFALCEGPFVRLRVKFSDVNRIMLGKVKREDILSQRACHSVPAEIEYLPQYIRVSRGPRISKQPFHSQFKPFKLTLSGF